MAQLARSVYYSGQRAEEFRLPLETERSQVRILPFTHKVSVAQWLERFNPCTHPLFAISSETPDGPKFPGYRLYDPVGNPLSV